MSAPNQQEDFFTDYLTYTSNNEVPTFFHRWACVAGIGAMLGRNYNIQFGHQLLNPNIYCMLIGSPGTRKSTAIKIMKKLLIESGYNTIAADKTTKEKFLLDLSGQDTEDKLEEDILTSNIFGDDDVSLLSAPPREVLIAADEFNDFFGNGNIEFISLLGTLWDYEGVYKNRIKNGKSVSIPNPTISILGGNTPVGFSLAFPSEILGQGFFSRILLIHGEASGRKIAFPTAPESSETKEIITKLTNIRKNAVGTAKLTPVAEKLLSKIYTSWKGIDDVRFESYSNRRFTHLLKLCLIHSASRQTQTFNKQSSVGRAEINEQDVIRANTVLTHTEYLMPRALGEFGKSRNSDVSHKIMQVLYKATAPMTLREIHKHIANDLDNIAECAKLLTNLQVSDKIQNAGGGFLPKRKPVVEEFTDALDYNYLTNEELGKDKEIEL